MDNNNQDILEQLFHLQWRLRRRQMHHLREHGPMGAPYQGQGRILALLQLKPQISQKELSKILDIRSQSLGELLVKLERQGYITRTPSETDRRVMDIRLTEAGKAAAEDESAPDEPASFLDCLTAEEKANLSGYLGRMIQQLEQQSGAGDAEPGFFGRHGFGHRRFRHAFHGDDQETPFGFGGHGRFI
jgi:DNA-binding MarR family transcriptional regulator